MNTTTIQLDKRTQDILGKILNLSKALDKGCDADYNKNGYTCDAYDDAFAALSKLTESVLEIGVYNLRNSLPL